MADKIIMCEVCEKNPSKYRCPRCQLQTCCLECVNKHKTNTECNGQRDKTAYVAVKEFGDINLLSDYRFLEDAGRKKSNADRDELKRKHFKPNFLKELESQASKRKIDLRIMPYPMSRRKNNFTTYNRKSKCILWQIRWKFDQADLTLLDHRLLEDDSLGSILDKHVGVDADPIVKHKLRPYIQAGPDKWALFMRVENISQSRIRYHRLDLTKSVTDNLSNKCVIEFPTIHVVLESCWTQYKTDDIPTADGDVVVNTESNVVDQDDKTDRPVTCTENEHLLENKMSCS